MKMINKPLEGLRDYGRKVAQEGIVLLENNGVLPLINKKIALFGRIQTNYYKSGTGSGGLVNVTDVPSFVDAVLENPRLDVNTNVLNKYATWINENPFNAGNGMWASEPWSQTEMEITVEEILRLKRDDEIAVMVIGRTAGEDRDNYYGEGSYLLTKTEYNVIKNLRKVYREVVVVLNVGNVIDLNFVKELYIDGLLIAWHGGQDGARATIDVLTGYVNPSGKLPVTIVKDLNKYPASKTFGRDDEIHYLEDIYVGYRFFETFLEEEVLYPFGYGMSYTDFGIELIDKKTENNNISLTFKVENTGIHSGKEVVQIYYEAPQGLLGKPKRELIAFSKTKVIKPKEYEIVELSFNVNKMASYDDVGLIKKSSYVLEKGEYIIYYGNSVREAKEGLTYEVLNNVITEELTEALAPFKSFERIKAVTKDNKLTYVFEDTPKRLINLEDRIKENIPNEIKQTNHNYNLIDVYNNKITLDDFVATLSLDELRTIIIGEGMSSPKVTPGTAAAFAGVTDELVEKGIPIIAAADGPSGIRMDSGMIATSLPNGTLIASTFNKNLVTKLYELEGLEMVNYEIDCLLGPGMNIQRHPLNGRNFEYFSEDPLLTGVMASAFVEGLNNVGVFGAMKHLAANNQEKARSLANSIISERALREIYLKPFEIAVKTAKANVIMTSYNPINGIWAAGNYDLNTTILRNEWGFDGILMTDWWAMMNDDQGEPSKENFKALVKSQNDLYMVVPNAKEYKSNLLEAYENGEVKLSELQRNAKNILKFAMKSLTFRKDNDIKELNKKTVENWFDSNDEVLYVNPKTIKTTYTESFDNNLSNTFDLIETKNDITYAVKDNNLFVYGIKEKEVVNEFDELLSVISADNTNNIFPIKNWDRLELDLSSAIINNTKNETWENVEKDSIYTFPIKVNTFGKYIIELEISSNEEDIHQMPFSIYINNINKHTITTNGTNGNKIKTNGHIVIDENSKFLSFKFHKTGINVYSVTIIKHG